MLLCPVQHPVVAVVLQIVPESPDVDGIADQIKIIRRRRSLVYNLKLRRQVSVSAVVMDNQPEISGAAENVQMVSLNLRQIAVYAENAGSVEPVYPETGLGVFIFTV